jgi:hypothetical protein
MPKPGNPSTGGSMPTLPNMIAFSQDAADLATDMARNYREKVTGDERISVESAGISGPWKSSRSDERTAELRLCRPGKQIG